MPNLHDIRFMSASVRFARYRIGKTGENPAVGALIVRDDGRGPYIVGRGVTSFGGRPHAEIGALQEAGELARGATIYVTLEPCAHYGKTPPCTRALIKAGINRVVIATGDPDPRVNGQGIIQLRHAGIEVVEHVMKKMAEEDLGGYLFYKKENRPEVTLKIACSADGCIGINGKGNFSVSGDISRRHVHILRAFHDAILVGIDTVILDNPLLNCRLPGLEDHSPVRIVLDSSLRISQKSNLVRTSKRFPLWIFYSDKTVWKKQKSLEKAGCRVFFCRSIDNRIDLTVLLGMLKQEGVHSLLVEGGAKVAASFWNCDLVDRFILFQSRMIIGPEGYRLPNFNLEIKKYRRIRFGESGGDYFAEWEKAA